MSNSAAYGDRAEAAAIIRVFGGRPIFISSIKSMTGHLLGGAGSLEAGLTVLALRNQVMPPVINIWSLDDGFRLNLVRDKSVAA